MKKTTLVMISALMLLGCDAVDDKINEIASGEVTAEVIKSKDKVLIISDVSLSSCVLLKNGLLHRDEIKDAVTHVAAPGVTCTNFGKKPDHIIDDIHTECLEQSLAEWLEKGDNSSIISFDAADGDRTCVIGSDI